LDKCKDHDEIAPDILIPKTSVWQAIRESRCRSGIIVASQMSDLQAKDLMPFQGKVSVSEKEQTAVDSNGRFRLRVALFGFGTVGSSVARILLESKPEGVELTHIYNRSVARKKVD
jgi:hypothetical protein